MPDEINAEQVKDEIESYYKSYRHSAKWWSLCLYSSLFGAAALSALAGVLPQLSAGAKDVATVLALTASLLTTITGLGRFEQKWRASRRARAATESLRIALIRKENLALICRELESIILYQSAEVSGSRERTGDPDGLAGQQAPEDQSG